MTEKNPPRRSVAHRVPRRQVRRPLTAEVCVPRVRALLNNTFYDTGGPGVMLAACGIVPEGLVAVYDLTGHRERFVLVTWDGEHATLTPGTWEDAMGIFSSLAATTREEVWAGGEERERV